jgi:hypothetical protein
MVKRVAQLVAFTLIWGDLCFASAGTFDWLCAWIYLALPAGGCRFVFRVPDSAGLGADRQSVSLNRGSNSAGPRPARIHFRALPTDEPPCVCELVRRCAGVARFT